MDILCTQDDFIPILDLWIQQGNFLFLKSAYDNFPWARQYINQEEKLKRLGTIDFYLGYFRYLRSKVNILQPEEIISLLRFTRDSESAEQICSEICCQFLEFQSSVFFIYKYQAFGDILYELFQHWQDRRIMSSIMEYVNISYIMLDIINVKQLNFTSLQSDKYFVMKDDMIIRHATYRMFSEYKFEELEKLLQYNAVYLIEYASKNTNDPRIIQEIVRNLEKQRISIGLVKQISEELYLEVQKYIEK